VLSETPARLEAHLKAAAEQTEADAPFDGLNLAMMSDGAVIEIGEGRAVEPVMQILHLGARPGAAHHLRHLIRMRPGSRATIVESWAGESDAASWTDAVTEIDIGDGAELAYVKIQDEAPGAFHLGRIKARLAAGAKLDGFVLSTGGRLARSEVMVEQAGEGADATLNGVYIARDGQHLDQVTRIDHAVPKATSQQLFKGVLGGKSRAAFQGNVIVRPDAQKTDARQANHTLLLSRQAEIDTKPELEIYADDVKCAHGATVGELDGAQLHYLMSRGIPEAEARALLIEAFVAEVAETIAHDAVRDHVLTAIRAAIAEEGVS
jgi:Fe-S cluster assembly protein SufD